MSKSLKQFNRWKTEMKSTWAFQVFNKYNDELNNMIWADKAARLFVYKILGIIKQNGWIKHLLI